MQIDFSFLKEIDFTNKDNLIFLSIFLILAFVIFFILFEIIAGIARFFKRLFIKPKFNQKDTEWLHISQQQKKPEEVVTILRPKVSSGDPVSKSADKEYEKKEKKDISASLEKLKGVDPLNPAEQQKIPTHKGSDVGPNADLPTQKAPTDSSIFGGKIEISREKLEEEMESNTKVWQASKQEGLNLNPIERAKLVKEIFSRDLGENISRTDLKQGIRRLNEKLLGAKSPTEHAKIRKEIKFFKKIGGIK